MVSFGPNHILLQPSQGTPIKWYEPGCVIDGLRLVCVIH